MSDDKTPPSLLIRVRDISDRDSWNEFEAHYRNLILRYCQRRGLQPSDCDDVQQIVWMHLSKGMREFEYDPKKGRFRSYLGRIVHNAIARHFARPKHGRVALDQEMLAVLPAEQSDGDDVWEQEWADHHYRIAMSTIEKTFDRRSVQIFARLVAGDLVRDVAGAFDTTEQAVHKVKQRVRDRMQILIAGQVREEDEPQP